MFGQGALPPFPEAKGGACVGDLVERHGEGQGVHHGAAAALSQVGGQGIRRIADNGDPAHRPPFKLDELERVPSPLIADSPDQAFQVGEGPLPRVLSYGNGLRFLVVVQHGQRQIEVLVAAWCIEDAAGPRPIFYVSPAFLRLPFLGRAINQQAYATVGQPLVHGKQRQRIPDTRIDPVGSDDEIRLQGLSAHEFEFALGPGGHHFR